MKKTFISAILVIISGFINPINATAAEIPETSAKGCVLTEAVTGNIIYENNAYEKLPMASTTKIMSVLLCLESGNLDEEFTVDSNAIKTEGSSMGLQEGDIVTKRALCYGMLLPSGNDAANAAAVACAGSIEKFVELMNIKAEELNLEKTFFVTPSGLEGAGHGSSAYDMAVLTAEALKNETFAEMCSCTEKRLSFGNPPYERTLYNTNKLLSMYDGITGVKTGFTDEAGRCLVSSCERNGVTLICVTLNDKNDWNDHMALYDYGFSVVKKAETTVQDILVCDAESGEIVSLSPEKNFEYGEISGEETNISYIYKTRPFIYENTGEKSGSSEESEGSVLYYINERKTGEIRLVLKE